jgi:hypothetical protein
MLFVNQGTRFTNSYKKQIMLFVKQFTTIDNEFLLGAWFKSIQNKIINLPGFHLQLLIQPNEKTLQVIFHHPTFCIACPSVHPKKKVKKKIALQNTALLVLNKFYIKIILLFFRLKPFSKVYTFLI